jgi:hypothetical protein
VEESGNGAGKATVAEDSLACMRRVLIRMIHATIAGASAPPPSLARLIHLRDDRADAQRVDFIPLGEEDWLRQSLSQLPIDPTSEPRIGRIPAPEKHVVRPQSVHLPSARRSRDQTLATPRFGGG